MTTLPQLLTAGLLLNIPIVCAGCVLVLFLKKKWARFLWYPLDAYMVVGGYRIFGDNKRWLGLVVMSASTAVCGVALWSTVPLFKAILIPDTAALPYQNTFNMLLHITGSFALIGAAYSLGELPNSFFKRRRNIPPGTLPHTASRKWHALLDLSDGVLAVALAYWILFQVPVPTILVALGVGLGAHAVIEQIVIKLKLKTV